MSMVDSYRKLWLKLIREPNLTYANFMPLMTDDHRLMDIQAGSMDITEYGYFHNPISVDNDYYTNLTAAINDNPSLDRNDWADIIEENFEKDNFLSYGYFDGMARAYEKSN